MAKKKSNKKSDGGGTTVDGQQKSETDSFVVVDKNDGSVTTSTKNNDTTSGNVDETILLEDELELLQVDLGDIIKIKQIMDETVAGTLLEHLPEDYRWDNFKLFLMALACSFAMFAQFAPLPFPDSRPILGICGTLYFVFSGILQLITTFIDQDSILWTLPVPIDSTPNKDMEVYGILVRTNLERFSEWYTVTIEFHSKQGKDKGLKSSNFVQQRWSLAQFFDKDGYFDEVGVTLEIDQLFHRLEMGDYDKIPSADIKKIS